MKKINDGIAKEVALLYIIYFTAVATVYFLPHALAFIFQIVLLASFFLSKKDYFWFALVFIIEAAPGAIFAAYDSLNTFSLFTNSPVGNLYFWIVFVLIGLIKSIRKKKVAKFFLSKNLLAMFLYLVFLIVAFGISKASSGFRYFLPWLFLYLFIKLMSNEDDFFKFWVLISHFVPFVIGCQVYNIITGNEISVLLGGLGNTAVALKGIKELDFAARPVGGITISFFSLVGLGLYFLRSPKNHEIMSKNRLTYLIMLSLVSVFLSATRGWFISSLFIFGFIIFLSPKNTIKSFTKFIIPGTFIILMTIVSPALNKQVLLSTERYSTLIEIIAGNSEVIEDSPRLTHRSELAFDRFKDNPIIGYGYGEGYGDKHVAIITMFAQTGIIGGLILLAFIINYIIKIYLKSKLYINYHRNERRELLFLIVVWLGYLIVNFITSQWFDYLINNNSGFVILFTLAYANLKFYKINTIN